MGAGSAGSSGSNDTEVSAYEKALSKEKGLTTYGEKKVKKKSINPEKDDTGAKIDFFINRGATKIQNTNMGLLSPTKAPLKAGSKATREYFYEDVLTSKRAKTNIGYTQEEFEKLSSTKQEEVYEKYMDNRMSGKTDAAGNISAGYGMVKTPYSKTVDGKKVITYKNEIRRVDGKDDPNYRDRTNVVITKNVGGQNILTTEGKVAEEKAKSDEYDVRKVKKEGRKRYTLTSSKGVTQVSDDYSLGKKSLLGTV